MAAQGYEPYPINPETIPTGELSAFARDWYARDVRALDDMMLANRDNFTGTYDEPSSLWSNVTAGFVYVGVLREQLRRHPAIDLGSGIGMPGSLRKRLGINDYTAVDIVGPHIPDPEAGRTKEAEDEALHFLSQQPAGSANVISSAFLRSPMFGSDWLDPGKLERMAQTHGQKYAETITKLGAFVRRVLGEARRVIPEDGRLVLAYCDYPDGLFTSAGFVPDERSTVYGTLNELSFENPIVYDNLSQEIMPAEFNQVFTRKIPVIRVFGKSAANL